MKNDKTIQIKAAFLLLVFSLNTLLGFACSLGIDLGYNKHHHPRGNIVANLTKEKSHVACINHSPAKKSSENKSDDCCSNGVTSFNLLNKDLPQTVTLVPPVFATASIITYFQNTPLQQRDILKNIRAFARSYHPPIKNIRIAIQSFLI